MPIPTTSQSRSPARNARNVERVVRACEALGLRVFYDRNETVQLWGKNVIMELRKVYGIAAKHVIPFFSRDYLAGPYPLDEFQTAMRVAAVVYLRAEATNSGRTAQAWRHRHRRDPAEYVR